MAEILITDSNGDESTIQLDEGTTYTLGRSNENDIVVADLALSRRHAQIYSQDGQWMIGDLGSSNGTFVGGRRLDEDEPLSPGVRVRLGSSHVVYGSVPGAAKGLAEGATKIDFNDMPFIPGNSVMLSVEDLSLDNEPSPIEATQPANVEAELLRRRIQLMEKANLELLVHEPVDVLLPKILDLAFEAVKPDRAAILKLEDNGDLVCRAYRGVEAEQLSISRTITSTVIDKGVSVLTSDAKGEFGTASVIDMGIRAVMAAPLFNNEKVIGVIYADSSMMKRAFSNDDLTILTVLASIAAIQIEKAILFNAQIEKKRLETEAVAAGQIQRGLLPRTKPEIPGYSFIGHNEPCYEAGGDYYDCLSLSGNRRGLVLGDVAGKGMGAALVMAVLQANFHARSESDIEPEMLLKLINQAILKSIPENRFVTLFYFELDPATNRLRCVNAGHAPPPMVVRASGKIEELPLGGIPIGVYSDSEYEVTEIEMGPGDFLFACSDGVTDITSPGGEMFGHERLVESLKSFAGWPLEQVWQTLDSQLRSHASGTAPPDDLTVVAIQRHH